MDPESKRREWLLYKGVHLWNHETAEIVTYKSTSETMNWIWSLLLFL